MRKSSTKNADKIIVDRTRKVTDASRVVEELRSRLTSNVREPIAYEFELMKNFASNFVNARFALPLLVTMIAAIAHLWIGWVIATLWAAVSILSYALLSAMSARFLNDEKDDENVAKWRQRFLIAQAFIAISWCLFAIYDCSTCGQQYSIIQFSAVLVFQAVTAMLTYAFGAGVLIVAAPASLILAIRFLTMYAPAQMVMGGIICISLLFFYLIANRFKLSVLVMLERGVERDELIAELETAQSMSEEARRRAEEANLAKSRFLATMSHELRTPLNAILGFSEVMKEEILGPIGVETYKEYVTDIHTSGTHLLNVINEILDLSRIEAGKYELNESPIRLAFTVEDACKMMAVKAKSKNITIETIFEETLSDLMADERSVRQITLNLLSNALKFTPNNGTITVTAGWTRSGGQYLSVRDTGPGIPEEEIPIVLSSFGQGSIAIKSAEDGSGLGLPIVQALVAIHQGTFKLTSKLRQGTNATAFFPKSRVTRSKAKPTDRPKPPIAEAPNAMAEV